MIEKTCDVAVIGGGPAGLSAATRAALGGAAVILLNDSKTIGGNYYKSLPENFGSTSSILDQKENQELFSRTEDLVNSQAEILDQARVWGIFRGRGNGMTLEDQTGDGDGVQTGNFMIYIERPTHEAVSISTQTIVLAPGVYDRNLPFPGWELPGVMTPGAVQVMLKKQGLLPGNRIIVCGTGPLQIVVAAALAQAGVAVEAVCDTSGLFDGMRLLPSALGGLQSRFGEAFRSLRILIKKRIPLLFKHTVFRAVGNSQTGVEAAVIGKITPDGSPIPGTQRTISVDSICCSYGFIPSIELSLHLGCDHVYDTNLGAYVPLHDEDMRTSQPGVFVAGDVTGVGGKPLADLQGALASISALELLGKLSGEKATQQRDQLSAAIHREQRFSRWLWNRYRIKEGILELVDDDTVICRCEKVVARDLKQSLDNGGRDLYGVKLRTRLGMGSCQGRYCMLNAALMISRQTGVPVDKIGIYSVRPPVTPTKLKDIAAK